MVATHTLVANGVLEIAEIFLILSGLVFTALAHLCHFTHHNPRFSTIFTTVDSIIVCFV